MRHESTAEHMYMKMTDRLVRITPVVDDYAISGLRNTFKLSDSRNH